MKDWPNDHDLVDILPIGIHRQIIINKIEDEFVDIVVNSFDATGRHDALLPGDGMSAGGVVNEGHQLVYFKVDSTGVALGTQRKSRHIDIQIGFTGQFDRREFLD